jgi:hypothetical protein
MDFMLSRAAQIFGITAAELAYPDVQGSLIKAAQLCWTYGAMPGKHVYLIPFPKNEKKNGQDNWRNTYAVSDSYEWRKASADIKASRNGLRYVVQTAEMTPAEVRDYVTSNKIAGESSIEDRGVKARVLLAHEIKIMAEAKAIGLEMAEYAPAWHYGFWRKEGVWKKKSGTWDADNIPNGRTRDWVALKRAEKSALAEHFELQSLQGWESKSEAAKLAAVEDATPAMITVNPHDRALLAPPCSSAEMAEFMNHDEPMANGHYDEVDFSAVKAPPPAAAPAHYPESWSQPRHAHDWAVQQRYCANVFEARNSWMKIIQDYGNFSRTTACDIFQSYYERQLQKSDTGGK